MALKVRRGGPGHAQFGQRLTDIKVGLGLPDLDELVEELDYMKDVLMGRLDAPLDSPYLALMEVSTAFHSRACEISQIIHRGEREGVITKDNPYYRFRTGELRDFTDLCRKACDLGSRRLTQEQLLAQQRLEA